jgi:hypothetical protein
LVLGKECGFILEPKVHRVLDGRQFIMVVPLRPSDPRSKVHSRSIRTVEISGHGKIATATEALGTKLCVSGPELFVAWELIDHPGPFPVPFGVFVTREDVVSHIARANDRAGHDPRDFFTRARETQDGPREDAFSGRTLGKGPGRFVRLRIVDNHKGWPNGSAIGSLVFHASDPTGDTSDLDDRSACDASGHRRQDDLLGGPPDVGSFPFVKLAITAVGDSIEGLDGENHLGVIRKEQFVSVEFHLDRFEHIAGMTFVATDETYELTVAVENRPNTSTFTDGGLAAPSGHCHREESPSQNRLLDPADDFQVIIRPSQVERQRKIALAEVPKVRGCLGFSLGVCNLRKLADVTTCRCDSHVACPSTLFELLVWIPRGLGRWCMPSLD